MFGALRCRVTWSGCGVQPSGPDTTQFRGHARAAAAADAAQRGQHRQRASGGFQPRKPGYLQRARAAICSARGVRGSSVRFPRSQRKYRPHAATGPHGKLLKIDSKGAAAVVLETDAQHITALALDSQGRLLAGTASPGILFRIDPARNNKAFILLDAGKTEPRRERATGADQ